eukprot:gnl/TRDRNA2_/TRDRNA2_150545_c0_seq2.p1 gnl/TRDRNA2_/TRDRNA2_150545_c0~~gnl/TRDRNA2_/TRDRNA2_150545_c0_seq2.p1  ORF type:complete len:418 (-),score=46.00 gnl/TRDRNA2_/TRDRNA2_150545_c0_seq2:136-1389(-)
MRDSFVTLLVTCIVQACTGDMTSQQQVALDLDGATLAKPGHLAMSPFPLSSQEAHRRSAIGSSALHREVQRPAARAFLSSSRPLGLQTEHQFRRQGRVHASGVDAGFAGSEEEESWPEKDDKFHRWISEDDPTCTGYVCKTPDTFRGTRKPGVYPGSYRVQFTLPGDDDKPKTIEVLRSKGDDNPSFSAVKVSLPVGATVTSENSRMIVTDITRGSNADKSALRKGDIIRAVSMPQSDSQLSAEDLPWWARLGQTSLPDAEEGMVILDGKHTADCNAALQENIRVNGKQAQVVLLIERPIKKVNDDSDQTLSGGFRWGVDPRLLPQLMPIPIPVDDRPMPPGPGSPPGREDPYRMPPGRWQASSDRVFMPEVSTSLDGATIMAVATLAMVACAGAAFAAHRRRRTSLWMGQEPLLAA